MILSLILCSRNDQYMGNSRWRLETALNHVAGHLQALGRTDVVEVVVADWGSEQPLREVVRLTPAAVAVTRFLTIPPPVAHPRQKDSPFPEVLALNAAVRHARGRFIGRIDQDTLVGERFLAVFFDLIEGSTRLDASLDHTLLYSNRREIPYRYAVQCPAQADIDRFVQQFGLRLRIPREPDRPFWTYWVGIWLAHRDRWRECGGYDERMLYYNWMEVDLIGRLATRYPLVDLGVLTNYDFYHLEHAAPQIGPRHDRKNVDMNWRVPPPQFHPNDQDWGLASERLSLQPPITTGSAPQHPSPLPMHWTRLVYAYLRTKGDVVAIVVRRESPRWQNRARRGWRAIRRQPVTHWPRVLTELWLSRR